MIIMLNMFALSMGKPIRRGYALWLIALGAAGVPASSKADTIWATAPAWGGLTQNTVFCYVFNANTSPVNINFVLLQIFGERNRNVPLTGQNCGNTLAPSATCYFFAAVPNNSAHSCRVITSGSFIHALRGSIEVRNANTILNRGELYHN
jgi:hypothetical protein